MTPTFPSDASSRNRPATCRGVHVRARSARTRAARTGSASTLSGLDPSPPLRGELVRVHRLIAARRQAIAAPLTPHDRPIPTDQHPDARFREALLQPHRDLHPIQERQLPPRHRHPHNASTLRHRPRYFVRGRRVSMLVVVGLPGSAWLLPPVVNDLGGVVTGPGWRRVIADRDMARAWLECRS